MPSRVSGVVIAKNEERHIAECLAHLRWTDELVVVDSFSVDKTVQLAEAAGATVYQRPFLSFPRQRNAALALASGDWVFFVDADERVSPELGAEVRALIDAGNGAVEPRIAGYWVPRQNIIWGRRIRHGGWYPDYQLRLLRRGRATYDEQRDVHEVVRLQGDAHYLRHALIHHNYQRLGQFLAKQEHYTTLEAGSLFRAGIRPRSRCYLLQPLRESHRRYVQLRGYRDGLHGFVLAVLLGYYNLVTYLKLRGMWRADARSSDPG